MKGKSSTKLPLKKTASKKTKSKCPLCGVERFDLNNHLKAIHKLEDSKAKALKSNLNMYKKRAPLPDGKRKSKQRKYVRKSCPYPGCFKVSNKNLWKIVMTFPFFIFVN